MKKFLNVILVFFILFVPKCQAETTPDFIQKLKGHLEYNENVDEYNSDYIYLEPENKNFINIDAPKKISSNSLNFNKINFDIFDSSISKATVFTGQEYDIKSLYGGLSDTHGKFTFGTEYDSFIDDGEMNYMTGVFTKIDGKHLALKVTARTETGNSYSSYSDKIVIAPELKITKRLSLLDIAQTDVKQSSQKNEIVLRYNPKLKKHPDDLFLELRAGNTYREMEYVKSSIRFNTQFKF